MRPVINNYLTVIVTLHTTHRSVDRVSRLPRLRYKSKRKKEDVELVAIHTQATRIYTLSRANKYETKSRCTCLTSHSILAPQQAISSLRFVVYSLYRRG
jgi:hypothetical protein